MGTRRLMTWGGVCTVVLMLGGSALAQLTKDEQKCLDCYNNKLRLVGQQAGKDYRKCVKDAGKGKVADADACVSADTPGKIAGKAAKVNECYTSGKCTGAEPIQQGAPGTTGINAMIGSSQDLVRDAFGDPITGVALPGKAEAKCQDAAFKDSEKLFTTKLKAFRKCKKDNMKTGVVIDTTTLDLTCMTPSIPDPSAKISSGAAKLAADVNDKCASLALGTLFQGECAAAGSTAALGTCLEQRVECRVCEALNAADGMTHNCDLFDDGLANGSCGLPFHKCVLAAAPASQIQLFIAALGTTPLVFGVSGALDIGAAGGVAACNIQNFAPINIPAIGVVCISPSGGCPPGTRDCAGGSSLGIDVQSDGNAGACTSNANCAAIATCPAGYTLAQSACTGFCTGGDQSACTSDAQCLVPPKGGACNGPDPVGANGGICQISCIDTTAHGAGPAGVIQCNLGANLNVETAAPCDGTDVSINVGQSCIPESTQEASSLITDANFIPASTVPVAPATNDLLGASISCATLDASTTTGLRTVGAINFFGSALGDLAVGIKATCQ